MKTLFEKLLYYYHISEDDYRNLTRDVTLADLPSFRNFERMDEAVELVKKHMKNKSKIIIYGDYDCDGITGTSILVKAFSYLNYEVSYYIPSRYIDGYAINKENAIKIAEAGYDLVITVDNGISANEAIMELKNRGKDVLILDHHERQEILPNADVIIHPILSKYSDIPSSGAFTAFMFSSALLNRYDKYLSTLAGISLISDMMPLVGYNRDLLRVVIKDYKKGEFLPIDLLLEGEMLNDNTIAMNIAPKINAVGRVDKTKSINYLVKFFTSDDEEKILSYKKWIFNLNEIRKDKTKLAKENVIDSILDNKEAALVIKCELEEGLLGLVANSLMSQFNVPVIVFTPDSNDPSILKGSGRSIEGFNMAESFLKLKDETLTCGGHAMAAGITIKADNFENFKTKFTKLVESTPLIKKEKEVIAMNINEVNEENYRLIQTFSPFGESWKAPLFSLRHVKADSLMFSKSREHIISSLGMNSRIIGFNYSKKMMEDYGFVDMVGSIRESTYRGSTFVEFLISDLFESK